MSAQQEDYLFGTPNRIELRARLQQAAVQYFLADQRLGNYCAVNPQYCAVSLSQIGYAWAGNKPVETENTAGYGFGT